MKSIDIKYIELEKNTKLTNISNNFNDLDIHVIDTLNWNSFPYLPKVKFKMFYSEDYICIEYDVLEQSILASKLLTNSQVYQDSCVEFFVAPGCGKYYNFEFNCIGTKYGGSGLDRDSGITMDRDLVEKIETLSTLKDIGVKEIKKATRWKLIVKIPFSIFTVKNIDEIKGSSMAANFYKCGDKLTEQHFVTWNEIKTEKPDFHRPEFFGQINFK